MCLGYPKCSGGHHKVQEGLADQHVAAVPEGEGQPRPQGRVCHLRGLQDVAHQVYPDQCWRHVHCQECWKHGSSQVDISSEKQKHQILKQFPFSTKVSPDHVSTEPAVFELACVVNNIRHVVVCGHSDCKAINLLYDQHVSEKNLVENEEISFSPLRDWVTAHGNRSMAEFFRLETAKFRKPLLLNRLNKVEKFEAYVDVDEKFNLTDKLSMINTLLQMENVKSYRFMRTAAGGQVHVHAFWFDIYTGEIHIFSRKEKTFIVVNDETLPALESELNDICSKPDLIPSPTASKKKHPRSIGNLNQPTIKNLAEEVRQKFYQHDCASHQHH